MMVANKRQRQTIDYQMQILQILLKHGGLNQTHIMYFTEITTGVLFHKKFNPLLEKGYVVRNIIDGCHSHYSITDKGKRYLQKLEELAEFDK